MGVAIICGEAREVLATLPAASVHCCICSPPYWNLRDYKGGPLEIGRESDPRDYVAHLVEVFAQVKRVLHPTGTLWVVTGDSYAGSWGNQGRKEERGTQRPINGPMLQACDGRYPARERNTGTRRDGMPPAKSLLGIPWRLAFALQDEGWVLRQEIIWSKTAPMPESVRDRVTRSHETVFMLSQQPQYFYDAMAIAEPCTGHPQGTAGVGAWNKLPAETTNGRGASTLHTGQPTTRNARSVWTINPQPFSARAYGVRDIEHYAVFPEELAQRCILAGTSEAGCCPRCSAPWRRVVEREAIPLQATYNGAINRPRTVAPRMGARWDAGTGKPSRVATTTTGWEAGCSCRAGPPSPCTTLDPFLGSGTTALVSKRLGRSCVGIELNPAYAEMARRRMESVPETLFSAAVLADDGAAAR